MQAGIDRTDCNAKREGYKSTGLQAETYQVILPSADGMIRGK